MKWSWILTLLSALLLAAAGTASAQTTTFHASGEFAETFVNANGTFLNLFAARGCISDPCFSNNTFIVFFATVRTVNGVEFIQGDGVIPDSAFDASSPDHATLTIDTRQVSGFKSTSCTFVSGRGFVFQPGPAGVIQAEWKRTRAGSSTLVEEDHTTQGPFVTHSHKNQDFFSAVSTGSFFGTSFSDRTRSRIGTNHNTVITRTQQN